MKKGVSPLIASVLLIAFAVTIGALVLGWGQGIITDNTNEARATSQREVRCTVGTSLEVKVISGVKKLCYRNTTASDGQIEFVLENNGDYAVEGVRIVLLGFNDSNEVSDQDSFQIVGGGVRKGTQTYNYSVLYNITQVEFIPKVKTQDTTGLQLCSNRRLVEDGIFACT